MRSWQRNMIAPTRVPVVSVRRSVRVSVGTAAWRSARAPTQPKTSSAISTTPRLGALVELVEERVDLLPDLFAAAEAAPVQPGSR